MRCLIPLRGVQDKLVPVPDRTLKIERENAWAMTQGYHKNNNLYYVSIFTAGENAVSLRYGFDKRSRYIPKVLSYRTAQEPNYPVSPVGLSMPVLSVSYDKDRPFTLPHKYVAILDRIFYIDKEFHTNRGLEDLWGVLCNNGVFDIWEPLAPYNRLIGHFDVPSKKAPILKPQILLLRIFELDREVEVRLTYPLVTDLVVSSKDAAELRLKRPIIPWDVDDRFYRDYQGKYTFVDICNLIEETLEHTHAPYKEELINNTSLIEIPV